MAVVCTAKLIWMGSLNEVDLGGLDDNLKIVYNLFQMVDFNFFCHRIRQIQPSNNLSHPLPSNQLFEYIYIYIYIVPFLLPVSVNTICSVSVNTTLCPVV